MTKESGYEVCNHTCSHVPCTSRATRSPLWNKEGNSAKRHANTAKRHPNCSTNCPANPGRSNPVYVRDATQSELDEWLPQIGDSIQTTGSSAPHSVATAPTLVGPSRSSSTQAGIIKVAKPKISVIFVADPTRYSTLADAVTWNTVYCECNEITSDEFEWLASVFDQSIFRSTTEVFIQEFVSRPHNIGYYVH